MRTIIEGKFGSENYLDGHSPKNSLGSKDTIWERSEKATQLEREIILDKLKEGKKIDDAELRNIPSVKPIDYSALKASNPTLYVQYYDELRSRPTAKGWLAELHALKSNNENPYEDISKKIIKGTSQYSQIQSWLADLERTDEVLIVSYENEDGQQVEEYLNAENYTKTNNGNRKLTRYSGIRVPYTIELIDEQIDEAKSLLSDILETSINASISQVQRTTRNNAQNLRCTGGDFHEIEKY